MRKTLIGIIAASLIIISFLVYGQNTSSQTAEKATLVEVAPVEVGDITQGLSLVGDIEARAQVLVFTKIPGKIQKLNVEVGSSVRKGDVLAVVEHKEL